MPQHRLQELPRELLTNGRLRDTMRLANILVRLLINEHGWKHILVAWMILRAVGTLFLRWGWIREVVFLVVAELGLLKHDWGLARDRHYHSLHSSDMVREAEADYADWGFSGRVHEIVRLLVRFHREEDFLFLVRTRTKHGLILNLLEQEIPLSEILEVPEIKKLLPTKNGEGNGKANGNGSLYYKVFSNQTPDGQDLMKYLQFERMGIPMLKLQALISIGDTGHFGWDRVREESREKLDLLLCEAKAKKGKTLYHVLKRVDIKMDAFEVAGYSVIETTLELRTAKGEVILGALVQNNKGQGLAQIAEAIDCGIRDVRSIIDNTPEWVTIHRKAKFMRPALLVLTCVQDPRVCPRSMVDSDELFGKYLNAFKAAADIWELEGVIEWKEAPMPPALRVG